MTDLLTFLRARLDEDERVALDAGGRRWGREAYGCVVDAADNGLIVYGEGTPSSEQADHIARHDPARELREVAAKRRILDEHERALERRKRHPDDLASAGALLTMLHVVKMLALPYSEHPEFRPEWRP